MKNLYECLVVGGGVAGSTAAYHLALRGYEVAVLERTQRPQHKVCGEFLSFEAIGLIEEMGIFLDEDSPLIKSFQLYSAHSKVVFVFDSPGRGVSRYRLDEELLSNAKSAGASVFRGVCMRDYHQETQGLFKIETNADCFYARHLFIATGKHDYAKNHKRKGKDDSYIGLKTHLHFKSLHQEFKETTVLFTFPGGYGGICPIENRRMNFCFVIDKAVYKSLDSNFKHTISFLRRSNPPLDLIMEQADFIEPVCAVGHIPYGYLRQGQADEEVYYLGDQRAVIPSFTGDGMAIALHTAKNSVEEFDRRRKGINVQNGPMQKMLEKQMRWALGAQAILKSPWLVQMCMLFPRGSSFLVQKFFQKTRVPCLKDQNYGHPSAAFANHYSRR